jgi:predicted aconitase
MYLTKEEEAILEGKDGEIPAKAMRILVIIGEMFEAENLIPIESAQIAGISYKTIGDAGLEFLEEWSQAKVVVESRMNPAGMDLQAWKEMGVPREFAEKQLRIIKALTKMGVKQSCSCTPYHAGLVPRVGSHIAWAESSAVCFANSVLGARTNREGGPSALSAAIIGKTPNYGLHLEKNRKADYLVKIDFPLSFFDYTLLGYHIGEIVKNKIPALEGIKTNDWHRLKLMGAAMAAGGGVPMFMVKDVTPEFKLKDGIETIEVEKSDLESIKDQLTNSDEEPDVISFGCPHCSYDEIQYILKRVKTKKRIWICTSREVKERIKQKIPDNVKIFADTCMVVAPVKEIGIKTLATDSAKGAHYTQNLSKIKSILKSREELLNE